MVFENIRDDVIAVLAMFTAITMSVTLTLTPAQAVAVLQDAMRGESLLWLEGWQVIGGLGLGLFFIVMCCAVFFCLFGCLVLPLGVLY